MPSSTNKDQTSSGQKSGFEDAPDPDYPGQIAAPASNGYGYIAFQELEQVAAALGEGKRHWMAHRVWYAVLPVLATASKLTFALAGKRRSGEPVGRCSTPAISIRAPLIY